MPSRNKANVDCKRTRIGPGRTWSPKEKRSTDFLVAAASGGRPLGGGRSPTAARRGAATGTQPGPAGRCLVGGRREAPRRRTRLLIGATTFSATIIQFPAQRHRGRQSDGAAPIVRRHFYPAQEKDAHKRRVYAFLSEQLKKKRAKHRSRNSVATEYVS